MGSICLSSSPNLRCFPLTRIEYIAITVPTGVEVLFSTYLLYANRGSGRKHLFLAAEGWLYFLLVLLELLVHIVPAVRDNLTGARIIDITLGALSSLPLLLYALFLYLFTTSETLDIVPRRFQRIGKCLLLLFIPLIVAANSVASFVGISHRNALVPNGSRVLAVQVTNNVVHTFLTSFSLALLTAYQALNFCFAFFRLANAFINSRRIEREALDEAVLFKGIGWITGGIKLGAIETVVGFAVPAFEVSLVRRIIRTLARICLVIGMVKGVDFSEDFQVLQEELNRSKSNKKGSRRSLRPFISNPRFSTFRQLSPSATEFHGRATNRDMDAFAAVKAATGPQQRVTIHFDEKSGHAPTLEMRFSVLDMPSPAFIEERVRSRPASEWLTPTASSSLPWSSPTDTVPPPLPTATTLQRSTTMPSTRTSFETRHTSDMPSLSIRNAFDAMSTAAPSHHHDRSHSRGISDLSSFSLVSKSVMDKFPQIPQPPSREDLKKSLAIQNYEPQPLDPFDEDPDEREDRERRRKLSAIRESLIPTVATSDVVSPRSGYGTTTVSSPGTSNSPYFRHRHMDSSPFTTPASNRPEFIDEGIELKETPTAHLSAGEIPPEGRIVSISPSEMLPLPAANQIGRFSSSTRDSTPSMVFGQSTAALPESGIFPLDKSRPNSGASGLLQRQQQQRPTSMESIDMSWLNSQRPGLRDSLNEYGEEVKLERAMRTHQSKPSLTRIKSVGKAPRRYTPTPEHTDMEHRGSIYIEPIVIPPRDRKISRVEVEQGV